MKNALILFLSLFFFSRANAQEPLGIYFKSNLLNLVAKRPSFSVEKTIYKKYGLELSYTSGELDWGRDYEYNGLLLRAKFYVNNVKVNEVNPFFGLYVGNLKKTIVSNANVDNTGFFSIGRNRDFTANSIRSGANIGFSFLPSKKLVLEATTGLGYGKYCNMKNNLYQDPPKGYLDFQLWLSVGYGF